jgi:FkbM family methyltransferase
MGRLAKKMRSIWRKLFPPLRAPDGFILALKKIGPSDTVIDCGANIGKYTAALAKTGALVHAFEPDPACFRALTTKFSTNPNVKLHQKAVSTCDGLTKLFMHKGRDKESVIGSASSSLLASKSNVDNDSFVDVETIELSAFVAKLGHVSLMKMDIEGFEIEVLNDMLDKGTLSLIDQTFVELHDRKNPSLVVPTKQLKDRLAVCRADVDLTWH